MLKAGLLGVFLIALVAILGFAGLVGNGAALPQSAAFAALPEQASGNLAGLASALPQAEQREWFTGAFARGGKEYGLLLHKDGGMAILDEGRLREIELHGGPESLRGTFDDALIELDRTASLVLLRFPEQTITMTPHFG